MPRSMFWVMSALLACLVYGWLSRVPASAMGHRVDAAPAAPLQQAAWLPGLGGLGMPGSDAAAFRPRTGRHLPLALVLVDAQGRTMPLHRYFGLRPVLLVLGYHRCPNSCSSVMQGVLEALEHGGLPADNWQLVGVSIDPLESAADAQDRQRAYTAYATPGSHIEMLVAPGDAAGALARAVGFGYERDATPAGQAARYVHPAGFVVATPDGRISRYFSGLRFDPRELREALQQARTGHVADQHDVARQACPDSPAGSADLAGAPATGLVGSRLAPAVLIGALVLWLRARLLPRQRV